MIGKGIRTGKCGERKGGYGGLSLIGCGLLAVAFPAMVLGQSGIGIDDDGNGLCDVWEAAYGHGLIPAEDTDGDGFSNQQESWAGTDPHDPASRPAHVVSGAAGGPMHVAIATVAGIGYQIEVSDNLHEWHPIGQPMVGDGSVINRELDPATAHMGSGAQRAVWRNLSGWGLNRFKNLILAGETEADETSVINRLEIPQSDPDENEYGQRLRGYLVAPVSGDYQFAIASDDAAEFWISSDDNPEGLQRVAWVEGWTSFREWDKYAEQRSGQIPLQAGEVRYFEIFHREYSWSDHLSMAWVPPGADPAQPQVIEGAALSLTGRTLQEAMNAGSGIYLRVAAYPVDSDADGVSDYEELLLGLNPHNPTTTPLVADSLQARSILASPSTVTLSVVDARGYEAEGVPARVLVARSGGISPLSVNLAFAGSAQQGVNYLAPPATVALGPGVFAAIVELHPIDDGVIQAAQTIELNIQPGDGYLVGNPAQATVTIDDAMDVLYVAQLRPAVASTLSGHSGGFGVASVRRAGNALSALVSLSFGGLSAAQTAASIYVSDTGNPGQTVLELPLNQVAPMTWTFDATDALQREEIILALDEQRLWARIDSTAFPEGEIRGRLVASPGWQTMPEPLAVPAAPAYAATVAEAARFLTQATFGPTEPALAQLIMQDFSAWIDAQLALPVTTHLPYVEARRAELIARDGNDGYQRPRQEAWWQHALTAPDQLRQRMAFALSQILVVSQDGALDSSHVGSTRYYDLLLEHAFGNYRDLMEAVTLSPMMGTYLSMMRNQKPDPQTGHEPDENYAREIMQLFSIGLNELHPDGSLRLDNLGLPIPTYTQEDTVALAHVFTGWGPHYDYDNPPVYNNGNVASPAGWFRYGWDENRPMSLYPEFHDFNDRTIVGGNLIPGDAGAAERLSMALDVLFNHPNLPPFIARHLIQKFVTSNPSPGYVYRVASVFADNGSGVRGDLGATLRALLLDYEARDPQAREGFSYGKSSEPLLRVARLLRVLRANAPLAAFGDDRYFLNLLWDMPQQAPLNSPSVFNFFQPGFSAPGPIAAAGLLSPEMQIFSETTAIQQANQTFSMLNWGIWTSERSPLDEPAVIRLNHDHLVAILDSNGLTPAEAQALLLDYLDDRLLFGAMSDELRGAIVNAFAALPNWFGFDRQRQVQRVQMAAYLISVSPEFFVQR